MNLLVKFGCYFNLLGLLLIIILLVSNNKQKKYLDFFLFTISSFIWTVALYLVLYGLKNYTIASFSQKILEYSSIFIVYFVIKFVFYFYNINKHWVLKVNNIYAGVLIVVSFFIPISSSISKKMYFNFFANKGLLFYPYFSYITIFIFLGHVLMFNTSLKRNKRSTMDSRLLILFIVAFAISSLGAFTNWFLWFDINIPPIGTGTLFIYSMIVTYAILKHELMDIRLAVTRTFSYGLVVIGILASFISVFYALISFPILQLLSMLILAIFWAFTAIPLSNFLVTTAKRKFIRGYYEPDKVISRLSENLSIETDRQKIMQSVENALYDAFELEFACIIIAIRDQQNNLINYLLIDKESTTNLEIEKTDALIKHFSNHLRFEKFDDLENDVRAILQEIGYKPNEQCLIIPLSSPEILEGLIVLGKRSSGKSYTEKDFDFIKQIITYVSAIFYKLTPYEKIQKEFNSNQKRIFEMEKQLERAGRIEASAHAWKQWPHEIKTPLSIIQLAVNRMDNLEDLPKHRNVVLDQIARCQRVIENMLTLNRTSTTVAELGKELNINDIISEALKSVPDIANIEIKLELGDVHHIKCLMDDIVSVIINLIVNAQQVMPNGGAVTIKTFQDDTRTVIYISDTGPGIKEELRTKIWEPFYTSNIGTHRGLGLSLVAKIITDHHATIDYETEIGSGTVFKIEFPSVE
ncbi:MAG: hypothetical protein A2Y40_03715 [Candidatus Margulisbacteria bacterium GWF2_35_9]|nr:MAG: hypothetical protein A2Y40_03715 [Candidatus Margulisbacteria bacterium GWF2_35_9]